MHGAFVFVPLLLLSACTRPQEEAAQAASQLVAAEEAASPLPPAAFAQAGEPTMTAVDPGDFTEHGFVFHSKPGSEHVVRLPSPGTDTWQPASSGEPAIAQIGSRKETTPDGKAALVFQYKMLQSGNVSIEFQRMEDGKVEGKRTITFMVR